MYYDWGLIEASFAQQYQIRLRNEDDMSWNEFETLLAGLLPNSPLGKVIAIRSEKDPKMLKSFTRDQKELRRQWTQFRTKCVTRDEKTARQAVLAFQQMMKDAFYQEVK